MKEMKKILAIGVILLIHRCRSRTKHQPEYCQSIQDDDLVEVTTQACGIKGYGNTTVKLTREQYQN